MSRIARDCTSENVNGLVRESVASAAFPRGRRSATTSPVPCSRSRAFCAESAARIVAITASSISIALISPSRTWARSFALSSWYSVRRRMTSCRWAMKISSAFFSPSRLGCPSTIAIMFIENVERIAVCLNSRFLICVVDPSFFRTITIRIPSRPLSSRRSAMPSIFRSRTRSAIFSTSVALFTWYGSSVTTICVRPPRADSSSIVVRACITTRPWPSPYASRTCSLSLPTSAMPAVGKSGPFTICSRSSSVACGFSINSAIASQSSPRLCGGMFVAMPTAMPEEPFSSRFGSRDGRIVGSVCRPS